MAEDVDSFVVPIHAHQSLQFGLGLEIVVQSYISLFGEVLQQLVDFDGERLVALHVLFLVEQDVMTSRGSFHSALDLHQNGVEFSFVAQFLR